MLLEKNTVKKRQVNNSNLAIYSFDLWRYLLAQEATKTLEKEKCLTNNMVHTST